MALAARRGGRSQARGTTAAAPDSKPQKEKPIKGGAEAQMAAVDAAAPVDDDKENLQQEQQQQEQQQVQQQQEEPAPAATAAAAEQKEEDVKQEDKPALAKQDSEDAHLLKHQEEALLSADEDEPSESEVMGLVGASAEAVEEEKRLHRERQEQEEREAAAKAARTMLLGSELDASRFAALNHLLRQSEVFSGFIADAVSKREEELYESMRKQTTGATATGKGASSSKSHKGKAGKGAGGKRARGDNAEGGGGAAAAAEPQEQDEDGGGKRLKSGLTPTQAMLPELRNVELKAYQLKGVMWLISMYENGVNGILADQMGLGKTVQTIGFLSHLKKQGLRGPYIVVGPLSTLPNWINEFQRFMPSMPLLLYHGSKKEREELRRTRLKLDRGGKVGENFPVIITSYEIVIADAKYLAALGCKYLVVDEGHRLKNREGKLIRELRTIPADNRLLLTGTPLQNNLSELWSLLNFLMPDVFKNAQDFEAWFDFSHVVGQQDGSNVGEEIVAKEQRDQVVSKLHAILKPFMLRRLKLDSEVDIQLPRKMEIVLYATMTETQRQINEQLKLKEDLVARENREAEAVPGGQLLEQEEAAGGGGGAGRTRSRAPKSAQLDDGGGEGGLSLSRLNNVLMQLRKNCNHPDLITGPANKELFFPPPDELVRQCGKMQLLERLLDKLHAKGHKVLIFSQMVQMLDIIDSYLEQKGHAARRLDGGVKVEMRQKHINEFNNKEDADAWVFLLSTRAGGLGINLTAADTVIIYDSDWNPHQDMQAMDRCHRIGQKNPVLVFRLATSHSVEVKMLKRAAEKMALERLVIRKDAFKGFGSSSAANAEGGEGGSGAGGRAHTKLSAEELMQLLRGDYRMESVPQSGMVTDQMLEQLLDREHLLQEEGSPTPYASSGVGYEVVTHGAGGGGGAKEGEGAEADGGAGGKA